jgi:hypothetical protein
MNSSGFVQASKTMFGGPLKVRVTTSSRSDFRSIVVSIGLLHPFQFIDNLVQLVEA